ncbi:P-loop containing nucleoside triphosphate hydrolase protein [Punctularia strigosozonata HHB-11173 SS5]|uniref:P-loop containing nucleoside triphosphate hydrolase protein n=1 Tax=Punctularia strigosozonata (strain HHB-11173) TaxID=741275 RepID=UPI00044176BD|nr:P-loop containing nucleoside triphosphate hydrolase protein [Punctularia strigosozonata HHB-11173 SS5]EIN12593.1 P-loop containing nucleoside triphosphate hydrolase protein [Punctularia strigosozonata HHB-11173 SS5]
MSVAAESQINGRNLDTFAELLVPNFIQFIRTRSFSMRQARERFNAKARKSTAGTSHKKGKRPALAPEVAHEEQNPNAELLVPKTKKQKDAERKERLQQELLAQSNSKMTSKKKRRLDKYIDKKLKQEERNIVLQKLAKSQADFPESLHLQSSSTLGTGKAITHEETIARQEDKEIRHALYGAKGRKRTRELYASSESGSDEDIAHESHDTGGPEAIGSSRSNPVIVVDEGSSIKGGKPSDSIATMTIGSALARKADGTLVAPRVVARKSKGGKKLNFQSWKTGPGHGKDDGVESSEDSFDSSDSAYDSDSDSVSGQETESEWGGIGVGEGTDTEEEESDASVQGMDVDAKLDDEVEQTEPTRRVAGFKAWAMKQLSTAKPYIAVPDAEDAGDTPEDRHPAVAPPKPKGPLGPQEMRGPLGEDLQLPETSLAQQLKSMGDEFAPKRKTVLVDRPADVQESRLALPIVAEEQSIMEAILLNPVVIICGETGSGKTTQVPQFLYEWGFGSPESENPGMIGVTQPRRVAAMSMAARVAHELSLPPTRVSYQIRYDATVSPSTSIKFMTDGVLLRELATDFLLTKYSVIIIDEAHERSMNTDILIGVLSRVLKLREEMWQEGKEGTKPLRLVIMSATLRVSDFADNTTLFATPPPIINVEARQHPVTVHFNRRTPSDYVTEAVKKASKIHSRLPPGGILVFLTGQNEISGVCRKLEARYGTKALQARRSRGRATITEHEQPGSIPSARQGTVVALEAEDLDLGDRLQEELAGDVDDDAIQHDEEALDSEDENPELDAVLEDADAPMHIVPLYSLLPSEKQMLVFKPPPEGARLVVVATNVAETSLTIPGIRAKEVGGHVLLLVHHSVVTILQRRYDVANGIQAFQVSWISKASAAQRAGRAGRTGPGHCYRLYSSALYEHYFDQFTQPEILRVPIDGVVLQMKSMHIHTVVNFPFPTPPDRHALLKAETVLAHLGAIEVPRESFSRKQLSGGHITELGKAMSLFPLSPRFSKMLLAGRQHGCLPYVVALVSALSVGDPFLREEALETEAMEEIDEIGDDLSHLTSDAQRAKETRKIRRRLFFQTQHTHGSLGSFTSDAFRVLSVVGAYEYAGGGHSFCEEHFVRLKAMEEIHKLRAQISAIVQTNFAAADAGFVPNLLPPNPTQIKVMRQLLTAAFIDQVAIRKDLLTPSPGGTQYATCNNVAYRAMGIEEDVFVHPSSVLASRAPSDFIVYQEVVRTSRVWMKGDALLGSVALE